MRIRRIVLCVALFTPAYLVAQHCGGKERCKATDDSDYHLVMTDDTQQFSDENNGIPVTGHSFVAELPDPNCLSGRSGHFGTSSPFFQPGNPLNVATARQDLEQHTQNP